MSRRFLRRMPRNAYFGIVIGRKKKRIITLVIIFLLLVSLLLYITAKIRPLMVSMAQATVKSAVTISINEAVAEELASDSFGYQSLISLEKDETGAITALVANMLRINQLQSILTRKITGKIMDTKTSDISIPLGNIIGGSILSGRGPRIAFRVISVSSAKAAFISSFTDAGINQTRHRIILEATVDVGVLVPGAITSVQVTTQILIAETILIGKVPSSYTYFESGSEAEGSDLWDTNYDKYDIIT